MEDDATIDDDNDESGSAVELETENRFLRTIAEETTINLTCLRDLNMLG